MNPISRRRLGLAAAWVCLQLLFFAGWALREAGRFDEGVGRSILVRTVPVDPRDLLRGQYLELAYEWTRSDLTSTLDIGGQGSEVWVVLGPEGEFFVPLRADVTRPVLANRAEVAMRGRVGRWQRLEFGIEKYFVPEGTETPPAKELTVRLRVDSEGVPRIETVYRNGVAWP
ncbi:MAG TPA: GDYXXLXY domain-containing protein [Planctomycetota bacterium]|nr:GDYXXLXY domain-containing protein [Planctomycetota bacterium]